MFNLADMLSQEQPANDHVVNHNKKSILFRLYKAKGEIVCIMIIMAS